MNCPFYGRHLAPNVSLPAIGSMIATPFTLIGQHGNQCAIVTGSYTPCAMEIDGLIPDWRDCPRVAMITVAWPSEGGKN